MLNIQFIKLRVLECGGIEMTARDLLNEWAKIKGANQFMTLDELNRIKVKEPISAKVYIIDLESFADFCAAKIEQARKEPKEVSFVDSKEAEELLKNGGKLYVGEEFVKLFVKEKVDEARVEEREKTLKEVFEALEKILYDKIDDELKQFHTGCLCNSLTIQQVKVFKSRFLLGEKDKK